MSSPSSDLKDDVDRLFACFKCGISPPESARKERHCRLSRSRAIGGSAGAEPSGSSEPHIPADRKDHPGTSASMAIKFNSHHNISPVIFYGSPQGVPIKRPLQLWRLLREIHVDLAEQSESDQRKVFWATFPRQEEAVKFARAHTRVFVFSYQDHLTGQRRFLASTHEEFWRRYQSMPCNIRHHYEVIQEGFPCHLYFDLEFEKRYNPDRNVDEMVDILVSLTLEALHEKYSIKGSPQWVIELDSSTEGKFSRHLIFRIPRTAFKDNTHAGAFISEICSRIESLHGINSQVEKLYIRKKSDSPELSCQLFIDTAVYTRNRCFRLPFSSKTGKKSVLLPTRRFRCENLDEKRVFMDSLICKMDIDCTRLLICQLDLDFKKSLCFESELSRSHEVQKDAGSDSGAGNFSGPHLTGKSPFPLLDDFVESIASNGNVSGKIRSWYWFAAYGLMVYSMSRNRYCERIGREHKSNHVMYVIDFQSAGYYQKCYDPDCRGYRSPLRPIPDDVIPDCATLYNSTKEEHYSEVMNISFEPQVIGYNTDETPHPSAETITDSIKKESGWWDAAIKFADSIEAMKKNSDFSYMLDNDWIEDPEWWVYVDRFTTQVENS